MGRAQTCHLLVLVMIQVDNLIDSLNCKADNGRKDYVKYEKEREKVTAVKTAYTR